MLTEWLLVGLGVLLTAGTAVFVASEFSLVTLDPGVVDRKTKADDRRGQSVRKALARLSTELSGAQVGITVTTILLGYTTQPAVIALLRVPLESSVLGRAAGLCGVSQAEFMQFAAEREVALHYTLEDLEQDRKFIERLPS